MGESLMQPCRVCEEGLRVVKALSVAKKKPALIPPAIDVNHRRSTGQLRASSRGNTEGANVNRNYWA